VSLSEGTGRMLESMLLSALAMVAALSSGGRPPGTCELSTTLCAQKGRFEVTVDWQSAPLGPSRAAHAIAVTDDSGYFWFFYPENVELMVKVLDARSVNGAYWVFFGALTNRAYRVTVRDTLTSAVRTYDNAWGEMASVADTEAFPSDGSAAELASPRAGVVGWTPIGPGLPDPAEVFSIAVRPDAPSVAFVSYYTGIDAGVARTLDGGATWTTRLETPDVGRLLVDPFAPDHVYLGTGSDVWTSLDGGETWSSAPAGAPISSLAAGPGVIYAGLADGLSASRDLGQTWTSLPIAVAPGDVVSALAVDPAAPERLYAGTSAGDLWRTDDAGTSWTRTRSAPTEGVSSIVIDPFDHDVVYAGTTYSGALPGSTGRPATPFLRSVDGGRTWTEILPGGIETLVAHPGSPGVLYGGGYSGAFRSVDRGTSWTTIGPVEPVSVGSLALAGSTLYAGSLEGAFRLDLAPPPPGCSSDPHALCLSDGRFRVIAGWQVSPDGPTVEASPIPLTRDTGAFWFFHPSNVELVVKVLDGRPVNGHFWVFVGGLSSVQYSIEVTDTQTGQVWTHEHAPGEPESFADTSVF